VYVAGNGKDGVQLIESHCPDLAIVDIGMPLMNGYEVARQVRKRLGKSVYLIALTGFGQATDRQAVLEAGFDEHLVKPLKRVELNRILQRLNSPTDS
jgi:two-component system CheB/CheR fusion protein